MKGSRWIPYDGADWRLETARALAASLRRSGEFEAVRVDKRPAGYDGRGEWVEFGRVFVARKVEVV